MNLFPSEMIAGEIRAVTAGYGSSVVLVPGWPESAEAYGDLLPLLAERHSVLSIDPPGLGGSAPSPEGYDTGAISTLLNKVIAKREEGPFHLVGHDVGAWIAYAWAAQFPDRVRSLTLLDSALPGLTAARNYPLAPELNLKLWQFSFNMLPDLPEILTAGRERALMEWLIRNKAAHPERIKAMDIYVDWYARPGGMGRGFEYYRATPKSAAQNVEFSKSKLRMPVLAIGGESGVGGSLKQAMQSLADDVEGEVIADCGHYVMEEQPQAVASQLLSFFMRVEGALR